MQEEQVPHFHPLRRLLFPYTGEVPLTREQAARVICTWAIVFSISILVGTLPFVVVFGSHASLQRITLLLLLILLCSVVLFSVLAWFAVIMINRSAHFIQQQKHQSARTNNSSGGRYGS